MRKWSCIWQLIYYSVMPQRKVHSRVFSRKVRFRSEAISLTWKLVSLKSFMYSSLNDILLKAKVQNVWWNDGKSTSYNLKGIFSSLKLLRLFWLKRRREFVQQLQKLIFTNQYWKTYQYQLNLHHIENVSLNWKKKKIFFSFVVA